MGEALTYARPMGGLSLGAALRNRARAFGMLGNAEQEYACLQDSYYPYAGPLRRIPGSNKAWENTKEIIKLIPLDNLQAMEAVERMKEYREESENPRKQDEEREAAKRRHQEEARLAEQFRQRAYDAQNAAVDQNELDRMFRASGK